MERYVERLTHQWLFARGERKNGALFQCSLRDFKPVRIPHDYAIEGPYDIYNDKGNDYLNADGMPVSDRVVGRTGALPLAGTAWYRRELDIQPQWKGKRVSLEFDGVMSHCEIYINGTCVGKNVYGYTSFEVEISDALDYDGPNLLAVKVTQEFRESRWYPGAGIYRNVRLVVREKTSIAYHSAFITTPVVSPEASTVQIRAQVFHPTEGLRLTAAILDAAGSQVAEATAAVAEGMVDLSLDVSSPHLWSGETPYLYTAKLTLCRGEESLDSESIRFGIRELVFDRDNGFFVNGKHVKIQGVCMHHDMGAIGTAVNVSALRRQFRILADMGCNSIRTSHNPPAPEVLELADELGFYMIVEQFDQWKCKKTAKGYGVYFDEWAEYDLTCTIRRDRNHPSVILWSIGNEIHDQRHPQGGETARFLANIVRREDPTRKVTAGLDMDDNARVTGVVDAVDIVGWNYRPHRYKIYHASTNEIIYGSETASCVSSRGVYFIPQKEARAKDTRNTLTEMVDYQNRPWRRYDNVEIPAPMRPETQVSSYDLSAPDWATYPEVEFAAQDDCPFVFGEYVWTGFDYMGEPTPFKEMAPGGKLARSSFFGIVDLSGIPKDRFYSYQAKWTNKEVLHLFPHWNWNEGDVLPVHCYSSYDRAELFVNGKSQGIREKKPHSDNCLERYRLMWQDVRYEPGEITVKALDMDGNVLQTQTIRTAGTPASLELSADREFYTADGEDLCYITVKVLDKDGNFCPKANTRLTFSCEGAGTFLASDNGDPTDLEVFSSPERDAFSGIAVGIFRTLEGQTGTMTVTVSGEGVESAQIPVQVR